MKYLVREKLVKLIIALGLPENLNFDVTEPPQKEMGDYATNLAFVAAKTAGQNPRQFAESLCEKLLDDSAVYSTEIAGPGFINIKLKPEIYFNELAKILSQRSDYGKLKVGYDKKANIEYVSANPTGPLHIGNARSGPIGLAISNLLNFVGYQTNDEFYVNDIGGQIIKFGKTLYYWHEKKKGNEIEFPEGGYPGAYMSDAYEMIYKAKSKELIRITDNDQLISFLSKEGLDVMIASIKSDLSLIGINIDTWTRESEMLNSGKSEEAVENLVKGGNTLEKDGALWFKRLDDQHLEDKESVLKKSDQEKSLTYFANDLAYHQDKFNRVGKDGVLVDVWGANHFGHIPRIKSALKALNCPVENLNIVLYQYVRLKKSGKAMSMGKRLGNFVTLREVIEAGVHPDAFKYFILSQNMNTPMDFDIDLATDTSEKNPVFYIKYAHARISSILRKANEEGIKTDFDNADFSLLINSKEQALYKELVKFPELIDEIRQNFQIQVLPHFAYKIAGLFHDFYGECKVLGVEKELELSRLALIMATKNILANTLSICGIEAPEKM